MWQFAAAGGEEGVPDGLVPANGLEDTDRADGGQQSVA
jgi:hypothetical protein